MADNEKVHAGREKSGRMDVDAADKKAREKITQALTKVPPILRQHGEDTAQVPPVHDMVVMERIVDNNEMKELAITKNVMDSQSFSLDVMREKRARADDIGDDTEAKKKTMNIMMDSNKRLVRHEVTLASEEEIHSRMKEKSFDDKSDSYSNASTISIVEKNGADEKMAQALDIGSADIAETIAEASPSYDHVIDEIKSLADEPAGCNREMAAASTIIAAMWNHPFNDDVQLQGCEALKKMARNVEAKVTIGEAGGMDVMVAAMRNHPSEIRVQEQGFQSLMALMDLGGSDTNKMKFFASGGIYALAAAMLNHPSHAKFQANGCAALWMLAYKVSNQVAVVTTRTIRAIVAAMRHHPLIAIVQEWDGRTIMLDNTASPRPAVPAVPTTQDASPQTSLTRPTTPIPRLSFSSEPDWSLVDPVFDSQESERKNAFKVIMTEDFDTGGNLLEASFEVKRF